MLHECPRPVGGLLLLEPVKTPGVRLAADHVGESVTVDVVHPVLAAAVAEGDVIAEFHRMKNPRRHGDPAGRLLEPSERRDDVETAVAVDIAHADSVWRH